MTRRSLQLSSLPVYCLSSVLVSLMTGPGGLIGTPIWNSVYSFSKTLILWCTSRARDPEEISSVSYGGTGRGSCPGKMTTPPGSRCRSRDEVHPVISGWWLSYMRTSLKSFPLHNRTRRIVLIFSHTKLSQIWWLAAMFLLGIIKIIFVIHKSTISHWFMTAFSLKIGYDIVIHVCKRILISILSQVNQDTLHKLLIYRKSGNFRCKNIFVVDGSYKN